LLAAGGQGTTMALNDTFRLDLTAAEWDSLRPRMQAILEDLNDLFGWSGGPTAVDLQSFLLVVDGVVIDPDAPLPPSNGVPVAADRNIFPYAGRGDLSADRLPRGF